MTLSVKDNEPFAELYYLYVHIIVAFYISHSGKLVEYFL